MRISAQDRKAAARFRCALDLHRAGVEIMRQNLRRRDPKASAATISRRLSRWLGDRTIHLTKRDLEKMKGLTFN